MIEFHHPKLLHAAQQLSNSGMITTSDNYVYLDIVDDYIHTLFPLLENKPVQKPDYFLKYPIGAHITVFYPEENITLDEADLNQLHSFKIKHLAQMLIAKKTYYVLLVDSPSLIALRKKYDLTEKLNFRGYPVDLHITIGVI